MIFCMTGPAVAPAETSARGAAVKVLPGNDRQAAILEAHSMTAARMLSMALGVEIPARSALPAWARSINDVLRRSSEAVQPPDAIHHRGCTKELPLSRFGK
jgi:hypothetical protein